LLSVGADSGGEGVTLIFAAAGGCVTLIVGGGGVLSDGGDAIGAETEAFAICDTLNYIKPPVHTICIGQAMGTAAMILSAGTKGFRASLPNATIVLHQARRRAPYSQATDIHRVVN
jgi:ATP-dependent Clp protease, protease subunit